MINNKILIPVFLLVALIQIYFPVSMILGREETLKNGTEYKFRAAPIDPNDPFRGKYVTLSYRNTEIQVKNTTDWEHGETIFVKFETDSVGYAKIESVSKTPPAGTNDYLKTTVNFVYTNNLPMISINFPFDRYYMEESKAPKAEEIYFESVSDTSHETYSLVSIKKGEAVLKDVLIDGISLKELANRK